VNLREAVLYEPRSPLVVDEIEFPEPRPREVLVKITALRRAML